MKYKHIYSSKPINDIDLSGFATELCGVNRHKRNNCGFVAYTLAYYLNNMGISAERVEGYFKVDIPDTGIKSFTPDELTDMKISGYDIHNTNSRI